MTQTDVGFNDPATSDPDPTQASAKQMLVSYLDQYGLGSLGDWAWQKWQNGEPFDQIKLELPQTQQYQQRFPAMADLAKKGRAISTDQYIALEQQYTQVARAAGLPPELYDQPDDFTGFISGEVSPSEFQQRVQDYTTWAYEQDPTTRAELKRLYGVDEGHIAAFAINADKALPILQRQFGATQAAAAASRSGYGQLDQSQAELLSGQTADQLTQGFGNLFNAQELFSGLAGEQGAGISQQDQLGATFLGDAAAAQRIDRVARQRKAAFGGGGGVAQTQQGYAGAG